MHPVNYFLSWSPIAQLFFAAYAGAAVCTLTAAFIFLREPEAVQVQAHFTCEFESFSTYRAGGCGAKFMADPPRSTSVKCPECGANVPAYTGTFEGEQVTA